MSINIKDVLKKYTMVFALIAVILFFHITTGGKMLLPQNVNNLISQNAYVFVLAAGMLLCILTGGNIDLACGSVVCFIGGIGAVIMDKDINFIVAVVVMLIGGILVGAWQGYWIAYMKVPPFIATLAGMYAFRGLSNVVLQGYTVGIDNTAFLNVFGGGADCYIPDLFHKENLNLTCLMVGIVLVAVYVIMVMKSRISAKTAGYSVSPFASEAVKMVVIGVAVIWFFFKLASYKGIPTSLIWIGVVLLVYAYITTNTTMGRYLYAVGGNEKATKLSGINTNKIYFLAYSNMGLLAGLCGMLCLARVGSVSGQTGTSFEMDAIASCFIGGASAYGGSGTVGGVVIGAMLLGVLNMGMSILGFTDSWQYVVKGGVLLIAVIFDVVSKRKKS